MLIADQNHSLHSVSRLEDLQFFKQSEIILDRISISNIVKLRGSSKKERKKGMEKGRGGGRKETSLKRSRALQHVSRHRLDFPLGEKKDAGELEKGRQSKRACSISPGYRRLYFLSRIESASSTHTGALWRLTGRLSIAEFISFRISSLGHHCPSSRALSLFPPPPLGLCLSSPSLLHPQCHPLYPESSGQAEPVSHSHFVSVPRRLYR